jgi:hypothetical protein
MSPLLPSSCIFTEYILLTLIRITEFDVELKTLKVMVEKAVSFFYPQELLFSCLSPSTSGWLADSVTGGNSRHHEPVDELNHRDSEVPIPPS